MLCKWWDRKAEIHLEEGRLRNGVAIVLEQKHLYWYLDWRTLRKAGKLKELTYGQLPLEHLRQGKVRWKNFGGASTQENQEDSVNTVIIRLMATLFNITIIQALRLNFGQWRRCSWGPVCDHQQEVVNQSPRKGILVVLVDEWNA